MLVLQSNLEHYTSWVPGLLLLGQHSPTSPYRCGIHSRPLQELLLLLLSVGVDQRLGYKFHQLEALLDFHQDLKVLPASHLGTERQDLCPGARETPPAPNPWWDRDGRSLRRTPGCGKVLTCSWSSPVLGLKGGPTLKEVESIPSECTVILPLGLVPQTQESWRPHIPQ